MCALPISIRDIECLTGIKAHTIRIWEQRYNLVPPKRTETNIRYYESDDLKKFLNISTLLESGIRISKVAEMSNEEMCAVITEMTENDNLCDKSNCLCTATLKLDEQEFHRIMSSCIEVRSEERRVGQEWES